MKRDATPGLFANHNGATFTDMQEVRQVLDEHLTKDASIAIESNPPTDDSSPGSSASTKSGHKTTSKAISSPTTSAPSPP